MSINSKTPLYQEAERVKASTADESIKQILDGIMQSEKRYKERERVLNGFKLKEAIQSGKKGLVVDFQTLAIIKE